MKNKSFNDLIGSIKEGGKILRGEKNASRVVSTANKKKLGKDLNQSPIKDNKLHK